MIGAHVYPTCILPQIVNPIGSIFLLPEIMHLDGFGLALRPPFAAPILIVPTCSFFFVSTEIAGWPLFRNSVAFALMHSNCALRSGCEEPSFVLRFACRLYFCSCNSSATSIWLTACPWARSSSSRLRTLLHVHWPEAKPRGSTYPGTRSAFIFARGQVVFGDN